MTQQALELEPKIDGPHSSTDYPLHGNSLGIKERHLCWLLFRLANRPHTARLISIPAACNSNFSLKESFREGTNPTNYFGETGNLNTTCLGFPVIPILYLYGIDATGNRSNVTLQDPGFANEAEAIAISTNQVSITEGTKVNVYHINRNGAGIPVSVDLNQTITTSERMHQDSIDMTEDYLALGMPRLAHDGKTSAGQVNVYKKSEAPLHLLKRYMHPLLKQTDSWSCNLNRRKHLNRGQSGSRQEWLHPQRSTLYIQMTPQGNAVFNETTRPETSLIVTNGLVLVSTVMGIPLS